MANGGAKSLQPVTGCRDIDRAWPQTAESGGHGEDLWSLAAADQKMRPVGDRKRTNRRACVVCQQAVGKFNLCKRGGHSARPGSAGS